MLYVGPEDTNVDLVRGQWMEIFSFTRAALQYK